MLFQFKIAIKFISDNNKILIQSQLNLQNTNQYKQQFNQFNRAKIKYLSNSKNQVFIVGVLSGKEKGPASIMSLDQPTSRHKDRKKIRGLKSL